MAEGEVLIPNQLPSPEVPSTHRLNQLGQTLRLTLKEFVDLVF